MKRVAFGTTQLNTFSKDLGIDGIGHYCKELQSKLSSLNSNLKILTYSFTHKVNNSYTVKLPEYGHYLIEATFNLHYSKAKEFFSSVDIVHSTDQLIPINHGKPLIATVMDTIPLTHPSFLRPTSRIIKPFIWKLLTQKANHIITISNFSKSEILNYFNFNEESITAIPLAVNDIYFERILNDDMLVTLRKYNLNFKSYFLFIGSIQPRKNIERLLKAHALLPKDISRQIPIVIIGKISWHHKQTINSIMKAISSGRCLWLSYVTEFEKRALLQGSLALTFVSIYEGFGLPILEGYASQTPVITSNVTSMPEVADDGSILVNPFDLDEISYALNQIISSADLRRTMIARGIEIVKKYNWNIVAHKTHEVYNKF